MESFYGGKQGASFVIVRSFDGVSIPQVEGHYIYQTRMLAYNYNDGEYETDTNGNLIERTGANYTLYDWKTVERNGVDILEEGDNPEVLAQGMVQYFANGMHTNEVGYGSYVIIDTITNLENPNSPDNGKVYRRGADYNNEMSGAEYIGCFRGADGVSTAVDMDTVQNILDGIGGAKQQTYEPQEGDSLDGLVPGKYVKNGVTKYNDAITYAWGTVVDDEGMPLGNAIGFNFPYLIPELTAGTRSPYYEAGDPIPVDKHVGDIIEDTNFLLLTDNGLQVVDKDPDPTHGDTGHSFYRKWRFTVPKGIKGDSFSQLEVYPEKIREGAMLYSDSALTVEVGPADDNTEVIVTDSPFSNVVEVTCDDYSEEHLYASVSDGYMQRMRCRITSYDTSASGTFNFEDLGAISSVESLSLSPTGLLTVRYTGDEDRVVNVGNPIKWLTDVEIDTGIDETSQLPFDGEGTGDQKVHLTFNTGDTQAIGAPLNYVLEMVISEASSEYPTTPANHLLVRYSDPVLRTTLRTDYPDKIFTHKSNKYLDPSTTDGFKRFNDWFDLGHVMGPVGEAGGFHIIGQYEVTDDSEISTYLVDGVGPETMTGDATKAGWSYVIHNTTNDTKNIYCYDYTASTDTPGASSTSGKWFKLGEITGGIAEPSDVIIVAKMDDEGQPQGISNKPLEDGIWLVTSTVKTAY